MCVSYSCSFSSLIIEFAPFLDEVCGCMPAFLRLVQQLLLDDSVATGPSSHGTD